MSNNMVELCNMTKQFHDQTAVKQVNVKVKEGEFLTLLGPSGCGKMTTLRLIAGFDQPTEGEIRINGEMVTYLPPYRRDVNTVFQSYALFPHMTVADNIAFGLMMKKMPKAEISRRVREKLRLVQLEGFADRKPDQLTVASDYMVDIMRKQELLEPMDMNNIPTDGDRSVELLSVEGITREAPTSKRSVGGGSTSLLPTS